MNGNYVDHGSVGLNDLNDQHEVVLVNVIIFEKQKAGCSSAHQKNQLATTMSSLNN